VVSRNDGLRNITGIVNGDGTATIYAVTSTVSGNGDQGADPNQVMVITDQISAISLPPMKASAPSRQPASERFCGAFPSLLEPLAPTNHN